MRGKLCQSVCFRGSPHPDPLPFRRGEGNHFVRLSPLNAFLSYLTPLADSAFEVRLVNGCTASKFFRGRERQAALAVEEFL